MTLAQVRACKAAWLRATDKGWTPDECANIILVAKALAA